MSVDFLRSQVLLNSDGERQVEVNQRHLIDKILARYSAKFVVFRELMQNSDDAKATSVQIIYETEKPGRDKKLKDKVTRISFKNNGFTFRPEDWNRLKKIAEGNPDEQKIGAFGVGFYSLFSICEEPFVSSGGQGMVFYWRGNQLVTKQSRIDNKDKVWTTFVMDVRDPEEFPDFEELTKFLANSLGFTGNLREVSVCFNNIMVIHLSKEMEDPKPVVNATEFDAHSPQKMFQLTSVNTRQVQLTASKIHIPIHMNAKQWRSIQITDFEVESATICLKIASANLDVKVSKAMITEMERTTKKKPPSKTTIQMIYTGFDEYNSSRDYNDEISPYFEDLLPYPQQGKIYIGFPTHQTTGCCSHLAARVIPTVERELIDLADKTLAKYNSEMLSLAGTVCRILYEEEMNYTTELYNEMIGNNTNNTDNENTWSFRNWFERRAAHALTHFTFGTSTPNAEVGAISESQFFKCSKRKLSMLSTNGVLPISNVRLPNLEMLGFIKTIPIVPKVVFEHCIPFFRKAKDSNLIEDLTIKDVLFELKSRTLSTDEMVELLKWWVSYRSKGNNNVSQSDLTQFMQLAHIEKKSRSLNTIRYLLNPGIVPPYMDVPNEVLPFEISKHFKNKELEKWFNWSEFSLANWAKFIVKKPDLESNLSFARKVHNVLAKSLNNTSKDDKEVIRRCFVKKKCIPTKFGMKCPNESYFQNVILFPDLPNIDFPKPLGVQNIMELLGVRKVVDLQLIFSRLVSNGDWDHMQLVKYLASKRSDLDEKEMKLLIYKPIWPKENSQTNAQINGTSTATQRLIAKDLFSPLGLNREFGLPVIDWKGKWNRYSQEGQFLIELGLQDYPSLGKILLLSAPPTNPQTRDKAFKYFTDNFKEKYSKNYDPNKIGVAFLPCRGTNVYARPLECFVNSDCMAMKFQAVHRDVLFFAEQFGVRRNPNNEQLLKRLIDDPPKDETNAAAIFEYLGSQQGVFTAPDWKILTDLEFIPTRGKTLTSPRNCFFKKSYENGLNDFFICVDFGENANRFLQMCGVKPEPSSIEIAELLVKSSREMWNSMRDNVDRYLHILRRIAIDFDVISKDRGLVGEMMKKPILLALRKENNGKKVNFNNLASAREIFINDDPIYQKIFSPLIAPEEDLMENLYKKLGCRSLHESVKETLIPKGILKKTEQTQKLQKLIKERACLFYHDVPKNRIIRDHEWLEELKVREIDQIESSYTLEGVLRRENGFTTACILENTQLGSWVLYVTREPTFLNISQHITKHIFKTSRLMEISYFNMILTTDLKSLEEFGYPVDRILRTKSENVVKKCSQNSDVKQPVVVNPQLTQTLRNSLRDSIKTCHSNFGSTINSQASVTILDESQSSYCDIIPGHLLYCVGTRQEIELYDSKGVSKSEILSSSHSAPLNRFINILKIITTIFELTPQAIHIFYDNYTNTIAFNRDRALFFNLKFYIGFHDEECKYKPTSNAMTYWFMTICHELAHNFVQPHSSEHEYYFSSFAEIYMSKFLALMKIQQIS